jgi:uridylate kinase
MAAPRRILLKLSGELFRRGDNALDFSAMAGHAQAVAQIARAGTQVALVLGGGNILRGRDFADHPHRADVDHAGMLATELNAALFKLHLENAGCAARVFSARDHRPTAELFDRRTALLALAAGEVVLLAGGTGNPFFSTDSAAALRAAELDCEAVYKGTLVDGVYDKDPRKQAGARRFDRISYDEVLARGLGVMDLAAIALCRDAGVRIVVFDSTEPAHLAGVLAGTRPATVVGPTD